MNLWLMTYPEDKPSIECYARFAESFGAEARPVSTMDGAPQTIDQFDGLLLSGGGDVEPSRYGDDAKHEKTYGVSRARDDLEFDLIERFIGAGKPVVGICRGLQILAVYFGGRLCQHIPDLVAEAREPHRVPKGYLCSHPLIIDRNTRLGQALDGTGETNSAHHQSVHPDFPPRNLRVAATSPGGIVEAVECFDFTAPVVAVQWHPERLPDGHPARERLAGFIRVLNFDHGLPSAAKPTTKTFFPATGWSAVAETTDYTDSTDVFNP